MGDFVFALALAIAKHREEDGEAAVSSNKNLSELEPKKEEKLRREVMTLRRRSAALEARLHRLDALGDATGRGWFDFRWIFSHLHSPHCPLSLNGLALQCSREE